MSELHLPWLELSILIPLIGACWICWIRDPFVAGRYSLVFNSLVLITSVGAWIDFEFLNPDGVPATEAQDFWNPLTKLVGQQVLVIDSLSAPLLSIVALLYFFVTLTTLRTKVRRFSFFSGALLAEAIVLATFCCEDRRFIIPLLIAGTIPPFFELRIRHENTGVYVKHMALYISMLLSGWLFLEWEGTRERHSLLAIFPLVIAVFTRSGIVPFHTWLPDFYQRASFGTAMRMSIPLVGAYATMRLVFPISPDWVMRSIGLVSLLTAVYAAGIALVQTDVRRFFCYLFISYSALVLVGLETGTPNSLVGSLCIWLAVSLSLGGFGLTLRALEARRGRLSLQEFQGLYNHAPALAVLFMITGLASVGFPGTIGFIGSEMLVDGAISEFPLVGIAVVFASALNGISVVRAYFRLFTGTTHTSQVSLGIVRRERIAVMTLSVLIFIGGIFPQYSVVSRQRAADRLLRQRAAYFGDPVPHHNEAVNEHH